MLRSQHFDREKGTVEPDFDTTPRPSQKQADLVFDYSLRLPLVSLSVSAADESPPAAIMWTQGVCVCVCAREREKAHSALRGKRACRQRYFLPS